MSRLHVYMTVALTATSFYRLGTCMHLATAQESPSFLHTLLIYLLDHAAMNFRFILHVMPPACLISKPTDSPASPAARMHLHKTAATADYRGSKGNT